MITGINITSIKSTSCLFPLIKGLRPVSKLSYDQHGHCLQLWRYKHCLLATYEVNNQAYLLSGSRIKNGLKPHQTSTSLLYQLITRGQRKWRFIYAGDKECFYLYPRIKARAGLQAYEEEDDKSPPCYDRPFNMVKA